MPGIFFSGHCERHPENNFPSRLEFIFLGGVEPMYKNSENAIFYLTFRRESSILKIYICSQNSGFKNKVYAKKPRVVPYAFPAANSIFKEK